VTVTSVSSSTRCHSRRAVLLKGLIIPIFRLSHNDPSIRFGLSINLIYIQALIVVTRRGQQSRIYDLLVVTVLLYMSDDFCCQYH
jgi:hypothetical protein